MWILIFLLFILAWLLIEGGVYFVGKRADDGWLRYTWAI